MDNGTTEILVTPYLVGDLLSKTTYLLNEAFKLSSESVEQECVVLVNAQLIGKEMQ